MEALLNKIDCLIILGEFEEAFRFNCLGFELFLELDEEAPLIDDIEKTLSYQKAIILFSSGRYAECCTICENNIIKFEQKTFFPLLCASLIANKNTESAIKLFRRFQNNKPHTFLAEVAVLLLSIFIRWTPIYWAGIALLVYMYFRIFSKNIPKRSM